MSDESDHIPPEPPGRPPGPRSPAPMGFFILTLVLLFLAAVYFDHHSGWFNAQVYHPFVNANELEKYQPKSGEAALLARGMATYERVCGVCHGNDGAGKPGQAPPLAGSEWVLENGVNRLTHIPLTGLSGAVDVKGQTWNLSMPAMGAALSDADLAAVLTYIRGSWGNKAGPVTPAQVKAARAAVAGQPPINGLQALKALPE
ncbi:MAG: cytochrome c [Verrucomicrobiota bacterium]|nr:cytochrome c [Verrucomicrobiota bacterium]